MTKPTLHYIGKQILIRSIRDFVINNDLGESDTILLHPTNFDDLVLEYRDTYAESINIPYFLLQVLIREDKEFNIPLDRVGVLKNDSNRNNQDYKQYEIDKNSPNESYAYDTIYRCGWCGNIVDFDGSEFDSQSRQFKINIHQKFRNTITEKTVNGKCCPNGHLC